jgi:hypothetical protein
MPPVKTLMITNGDSAADLLRAAGHQADILPWRDVLHDGPVPLASEDHADDLESLSAIRATFLADAFGQPEAELRRGFVDRDRTLRGHSAYGEITLWFEHDLYDQLQLLQILSFFHREKRVGRLQLVQADDYLGRQTEESIARFEAKKTDVSAEQLRLAGRLFQAFRQSTPEKLAGFLEQDLAPLPYMKPALRRLFEELPSVESGLSRTQRQALRLIAQNDLPPRRLFGRSQALEEAIFMGDWSFWSCLEELAFNRRPLVHGLPFRFIEAASEDDRLRYLNSRLGLTEIGGHVLSGETDHARINRIDRWLGGTHVTGDSIWRWDHDLGRLVSPRS